MNFIDNDKFIVSGFIDGTLMLINTIDMKIVQKFNIDRQISKPSENLDPGNAVFKNLNFFRFIVFQNIKIKQEIQKENLW